MEIKDTNIDTRLKKILINAGIDTVKKLTETKWSDVLRLRGVGQKYYEQIVDLVYNWKKMNNQIL